MFNNEYFKILALRPAKIKDKFCVGTLDDQPANSTIVAYANVFKGRWTWPEPWSKSKTDPGIMSWRVEYFRGPQCSNAEDEDATDSQFFVGPSIDPLAQEHGYKNGWEWCCAEKASRCYETGTCPPACTRQAQGRLRETSADIGFYLKWQIDDQGLPYGCGIFDNIQGGHSKETFSNTVKIGNTDCPLQDLLERGDKGKPLWQRVEAYADDQELWLKDFSNSLFKMQTNGYKKTELVPGPSQFWTFDCKLSFLF